MRSLNRILKEQKGNTLILSMAAFFVGFLFFAFIADILNVSIARYMAYSSTKIAARGGARQLDREALADGLIRIDPVKAEQVFEEVLLKNVKADHNGQPLPGSWFKDTVYVESFYILDTGEIDPVSGDVIESPTVCATVVAPVKTIVYRFVSGPINVRVHSDAAATQIGGG